MISIRIEMKSTDDSTVNTEGFGALLYETGRAWRNKLDQRLRPLGLSQAKWIALLQLSKCGDGMTQKELAERIGIEEPTLVGLLDRLTADGWIERREADHDRRCKTVHLRRKAQTVLQQINKVAAGVRTELLVDINEAKLHKCMEVLRKIKERAETLK